MGYPPRVKSSSRTAGNEYTRPLRQKGKAKERRRIGKLKVEEKLVATAKEVSEATLRQLHTLGKQRFGSSPFSEHFDRWLANVAGVLGEFESNPDIRVDDQFVAERAQIVSQIELRLEARRRKEATLGDELKGLSESKNLLAQIKTEYLSILREIKGRKNGEVRRLYANINRLKKAQNEVIRMKTGFFRGVSRKEREQKEIVLSQELSDRQRDLELVMLDFNAAQQKLRDEYDKKRTPVVTLVKDFQKRIDSLDEDRSLEDRWFACEALIDAVNTFLQRKAPYSHESV